MREWLAGHRQGSSAVILPLCVTSADCLGGLVQIKHLSDLAVADDELSFANEKHGPRLETAYVHVGT